jgi:hypothetical protein
MWKCRKCGKQADATNRICRACGGIVESVSDAPPSIKHIQAADEVALELLSDRTSPTAKSDAWVAEVGSASEHESVRPDWKCSNCGEAVPGQFDECWKCQSTRMSEEVEDATPPLPSVAENRGEIEVSTSLMPYGDEEAVPSECAFCGSTKIISGVTIRDQGQGSDGKLQAVVFGNPEALIFKDRLYGELTADICGECGHVELRVANPGQLFRHYVQSRGVDETDAPESKTKADVAWDLKRLLRKTTACERRGEYKEAIHHLEQFISRTDNTSNIDLARAHIRRIQKRISDQGQG